MPWKNIIKKIYYTLVLCCFFSEFYNDNVGPPGREQYKHNIGVSQDNGMTTKMTANYRLNKSIDMHRGINLRRHFELILILGAVNRIDSVS